VPEVPHETFPPQWSPPPHHCMQSQGSPEQPLPQPWRAFSQLWQALSKRLCLRCHHRATLGHGRNIHLRPWTKERRRKDYTFWCQFNEKPKIMLCCPKLRSFEIGTACCLRVQACRARSPVMELNAKATIANLLGYLCVCSVPRGATRGAVGDRVGCMHLLFHWVLYSCQVRTVTW